MEEINQLIRKEIDKQVEVKMTAFIELISKTYDISLKVLLRDLEKTELVEKPVEHKRVWVFAQTRSVVSLVQALALGDTVRNTSPVEASSSPSSPTTTIRTRDGCCSQSYHTTPVF